MSKRMTVQDIAKMQQPHQDTAYEQYFRRPPAPTVKAPRSKFRNIRTEANGIKFPSKLQAKHYGEFQQQLAAGLIRGYAHEVSIPIGNSKRRMRIDHMIVMHDGTVCWYDSKGLPTEAWKLKCDLLQSQLGIRIECI